MEALGQLQVVDDLGELGAADPPDDEPRLVGQGQGRPGGLHDHRLLGVGETRGSLDHAGVEALGRLEESLQQPGLIGGVLKGV